MQGTSPISGMPNTRSGIVRGTGGFSIIGLPIALIIGAIGAVAIGAALFYSGKLIYLIFVSVIIAAALVGTVAVIAMSIGKVRNNILAFLLGAIIGIGAYGAYRVIEYLDFIQETKNEVHKEDPTAKDADIEVFINYQLRLETGDDGFIGFTKYMAQEGFSVTRATSSSSSSSGLDIKDGLAWGYWGLEVLIMAFGGGLGAISKSKQPYCREEGRWLKYQPQAQVPREYADAFMMAFKNGDLRGAAQYLQPIDRNAPLPKLYIELGRCNDQVPDGVVKITALRPQVKNKSNDQVLFDGEVGNVNLLFNR